MEKFGDLGFRKHKAMAKLWGLLTVRLASQAVLPFSAKPYAESLKKGFSSLGFSNRINYRKLGQAIDRFSDKAARLDKDAEAIRGRLDADKNYNDSLLIDNINARYMSIEKAFLNEEGLPQRRWYKHMVCCICPFLKERDIMKWSTNNPFLQAFGPGLWEGYGGVVFPAIADALLLHDSALIQEAVDATTKAIKKVTKLMGTKI